MTSAGKPERSRPRSRQPRRSGNGRLLIFKNALERSRDGFGRPGFSHTRNDGRSTAGLARESGRRAEGFVVRARPDGERGVPDGDPVEGRLVAESMRRPRIVPDQGSSGLVRSWAAGWAGRMMQSDRANSPLTDGRPGGPQAGRAEQAACDPSPERPEQAYKAFQAGESVGMRCVACKGPHCDRRKARRSCKPDSFGRPWAVVDRSRLIRSPLCRTPSDSTQFRTD
jgi:hypothetical protein